MDQISDVQIGPMTESKYIQTFRVAYKQNGKQRYWDCMRQHDSVGVLMYNSSRQTLVTVSQFRPAVYMSSNRAVWQNSDIFRDGSLSMKPNTDDNELAPKDEGPIPPTPRYGPAQEGVTYELCAGIIDKDLPLNQIAKEEILEETGYDVNADELHFITEFWSNIGTAGSRQSLFYCEVTDEMCSSKGGGNPLEGELIDVVHIPLSDIDSFVLDSSKKKSMGLCFGFMWFSKTILPTLKK